MVCPSVSAIRDSQSRHPAATRALRLEARQQSPYNLPRGEMGMRPILIVITHAWRASSWTECPSAGLQALPFGAAHLPAKAPHGTVCAQIN